MESDRGTTAERSSSSVDMAREKLCAERPEITMADQTRQDPARTHRLPGTYPQDSPPVASVLVKTLADLAQITLQARILEGQVGDLLDGMERGGVVPSPEGVADHRQ